LHCIFLAIAVDELQDQDCDRANNIGRCFGSSRRVRRSRKAQLVMGTKLATHECRATYRWVWSKRAKGFRDESMLVFDDRTSSVPGNSRKTLSRIRRGSARMTTLSNGYLSCNVHVVLQHEMISDAGRDLGATHRIRWSASCS
jgi:hypothetical protein